MILAGLALITASPNRAETVISEFMASNSATLADNDGVFSDWIELYNPDSTPANLSGWFLTDSAKTKKKWQLPAVTIPPQGFLVVFASGKDRRDPAKPLHTNFSLSTEGEYLALIRPDGETASTEFAPEYPAQRTDVSYGVGRSANSTSQPAGFLRSPTPGALNSPTVGGALVETVSFSRPAGPYLTAFSLELSGATSGQNIRYVLIPPGTAGTSAPEPTATSPLYTGPISITTSVVVKAAVFSANNESQGVSSSAQFVKIAPSGTPSLTSFSSILPVLVLDDHGAGPLKKDLIDHPGWIYRYPAQAGGAPSLANGPDLVTPITMTVRGTSSAGFPKKGYNTNGY